MIDIKIVEDDSPPFKLFLSEEMKTLSYKNSTDNTYDNTPSSTISNIPLPYLKKEVTFSISAYSIINLFIKTCKKSNFSITEQTPNTCTVYHTQNCSFKSILSYCFCKGSRSIITGIRLVIGSNSRFQMRTIYAKGILGNIQLIEKIFKDFYNNLEFEIGKLDKNTYQHISEEEEEVAITCKHQSNSYYEFYKILSCEAYSLGKSVNEFCNYFMNQYRNISESSQLLSQAHDSIQATIENTVETLFTHYNYGKKNTERVMIYCRPAVEKYIFAKLHDHLIQIYRVKYEMADNLLENKRKIIKELNSEEIMRLLDINEIFWLNNEIEPYQEAIEILEKIHEYLTPTEKLNCLMSFEVAMKSSVVQYWKGRTELDPENALIVSKYIVLKAKFISPNAEIAFIKEYLDNKNIEEKIIVENIEKTLFYLTK